MTTLSKYWRIVIDDQEYYLIKIHWMSSELSQVKIIMIVKINWPLPPNTVCMFSANMMRANHAHNLSEYTYTCCIIMLLAGR